MQLIVKPVSQLYGFATDCGTMVGRKVPAPLLKRFRAFVDKNPRYYKMITKTPYKKVVKEETQYHLICFLHYFENRELLDSGSRSVKLEDDIEGLKVTFRITMGGG